MKTELKQYSELAKTTAIYSSEKALEYLVLGLASESGEVAGKLKKFIRDNKKGNGKLVLSEAEKLAIQPELGDVFWYLIMLHNELGIDPEETLALNIAKLQRRKETNNIMGSGDNR